MRISKNYVPNQGLLDPGYCPPELYVMPEETPSPPPGKKKEKKKKLC
jgi:hypothetical protein